MHYATMTAEDGAEIAVLIDRNAPMLEPSLLNHCRRKARQGMLAARSYARLCIEMPRSPERDRALNLASLHGQNAKLARIAWGALCRAHGFNPDLAALTESKNERRAAREFKLSRAR